MGGNVHYRKREPAADQQIADARAEPTSAEIEAQMQDVQLGSASGLLEEALAEGNRKRIADLKAREEFPDIPDTLTLSGTIAAHSAWIASRS